MTPASAIPLRGRNTRLRDRLNRLQDQGKIVSWKFDTGPQDQLHYAVRTHNDYLSAPLGEVNAWLDGQGWA